MRSNPANPMATSYCIFWFQRSKWYAVHA